MIQEAQDLAIVTLANCLEFQTLVGSTGNATRAKESVFGDVLPEPESDRYTADELDQLRPFALVYTPEDITGFRYTRVATGCWNAEGRIAIKLERSVGPSETAGAADRKFRRILSTIVKQLADQRDTAERLLSKRFEVEGPYRVSQEDLEEVGDHQWAFIYIDWGLDA